MEATTLVFTVSELASQEIAKIAAENNIENPMLRVRVVPGGCSGFQYAMGFDDSVEESDIVLESNGTKITTVNVRRRIADASGSESASQLGLRSCSWVR